MAPDGRPCQVTEIHPPWLRTRQKLHLIPYMRLSSDIALRAVEASVAAVYAEEDRLCAIVDSQNATPDQKYEALVELARISGILTGKLADAA